jgi:integrase
VTANALAVLPPPAVLDRWSLAPPPVRVPTLEDDVTRFLAALATRRKPKTVATYAWALKRFARFVAGRTPAPRTGADLTPRHAAAFVRWLTGTRVGTPRATVRLYVSALSRFYAFLGLPWVPGLASAVDPASERRPGPARTGAVLVGVAPGVRIDEHPVATYLARLGSDASRATMRSHLGTIARLLSRDQDDAWSLDWAAALTYGRVAALKAALGRRYARRSANAVLSAVRGVARECWLLGLMGLDAHERIRSVKDISGEEIPAGRALGPDEIAALGAACRAEPGPTGVRDLALLALLCSGGLRVGELCHLDLGDVDPAAGALRVRHAKGRKQRLVPLLERCAELVGAWLAVRGYGPGPLFRALDRCVEVRTGGSADPGLRRLTEQSVRDVCARRAEQAGIAPFRPHDLRRTYIGDLLDAGVDLATVQRLAGHADPGTTSRYDRRGLRTRRAAVARLDLPL